MPDRWDFIELGPMPEPTPTPAPAAPPPVAESPPSIDVPEVGMQPGNEVMPQDNPPWVLPDLPTLPTLGDWRDPGEDPPGDTDETEGSWRALDRQDLPSLFLPAPDTITNQLWKEYVGRGYKDLPTNLPDVGQQIDAGLPSVSQVRNRLMQAGSATTEQTSEFSLPSFDLFGGLLASFSGLGLFLDGLIGLFSLSWLFGPSKAPAVRLVLYAVPLELGVMAYNALTNKGVRATAVEYVSDVPGVMEEFFFNVPDTQAEWTEYILRSIKLMWRRVDE